MSYRCFFVQCFVTVGWMSWRASGPCSIYVFPKVLFENKWMRKGNQLTRVHLENGGGCVGSGRVDFLRLRCLVLALVRVMTFYLTLMFGRRCRAHCIDWAWRWYWDFTRAVWPISSYLWRGASLVLLSWYWYLVASWKIVQQWWLQSLLCRKWCPA